MQLQSIKYSQFAGQPNEWDLDRLDLSPLNLVVGENASGKSRTLRVICNLALLLCGELRRLTQGNFSAQFTHNNKIYHYELIFDNGEVIKEIFAIDNKRLLDRGKDGRGKIFAEQLGKEVEFQTPNTQIEFAVRRDSIQYPYLEPLYIWAKSMHYYPFGTSLGKDTQLLEQQIGVDPDTRWGGSDVLLIFSKGERLSGFKEAVIEDMAFMGYSISDIKLSQLSSIKKKSNGIYHIFLKESDLEGETQQFDISQGMFRVLSLIIQLNYLKMTQEPSCIIIDDIGEGLDYERSCKLIELIIKKARTSNFQLIMATNDRFVMNNVPLEYWTVLQRKGKHCHVFNFQNSKEKFEEFRFTGLNNFDFFASDYLIKDND